MGARGNDSGKIDGARLRRQRTVLCRFGEEALRADALDAVLGAATEAVSEAIEVRLVKVLEWLPEQHEMLVRAGVGWKPGVVGQATIGADGGSPAGYALMTGEPVISDSLADEKRFRIPALLRDHGVRSMVNVAIPTRGGPWGVLEADSPEGRQFDQDDILFLRNYSNLVGAAIERVQANRERDAALEQNRVLLREAQHRVANMLANVSALATLTRKESATLDEFGEAFDARLGALMRTQNLLTRGTDLHLDLRDVLGQELEAHGIDDSRKPDLNGPQVRLPPDVARALGMVFHELATNAVKHGAFREDGGRLAVSWQVRPHGDDDGLMIRWREAGVRITGTPWRRGLGFRMINESVPYMVGGTSSFSFHPDGLEYTLRFPLRERRAIPAGDGDDADAPPPGAAG